jgi:hypothetical protein
MRFHPSRPGRDGQVTAKTPRCRTPRSRSTTDSECREQAQASHLTCWSDQLADKVGNDSGRWKLTGEG